MDATKDDSQLFTIDQMAQAPVPPKTFAGGIGDLKIRRNESPLFSDTRRGRFSDRFGCALSSDTCGTSL